MDTRGLGFLLNSLVLVVAAGLSGACRIDAQSQHVDGTFERTLSVSGPTDLDVLSQSGRIQIHAGSADAVHVIGHIRAYGGVHWLDRTSAEERVKKIEMAPPIEQTGDLIKIGNLGATMSDVAIDYEITAPIDTRVRTSSRAGDQQIGSIRGPVTATSRSGSITIDRVGSDVDVETRSGTVEVTDQTSAVRASSRSGAIAIQGGPTETWSVVTRSGDVDLQLSGNAGAQLDLQTSSGSIDTTTHSVQTTDVRSRKRLQGTLGHGGSHLQVTTRSGQIRIR